MPKQPNTAGEEWEMLAQARHGRVSRETDYQKMSDEELAQSIRDRRNLQSAECGPEED